MQVIDFLAAFPTRIRYEAKPVIMAGGATVFKSQFLRQYHHST